MRLKAQMRAKLAEGFSPHTACETKGRARRHHQADDPTSACLGFPQPRLRVAVAAFHGLRKTALSQNGVFWQDSG